MKYNSGFIVASVILMTTFSCKKEKNAFFANGNAVTLSSNVTTVAPTAADSLKTVLTLSWSNPKYSTDSAHQKFIVEIDSSGRNFAHKVTFEADGPLSFSFTGNQLNTILANFGFTAGNPTNVDFRVTSSYANNNEQYQSNVITVAMTPFLVPITLTPSSGAPLILQISNATGNAISFSWNASPYGGNVINYALQLDTVGGNFANPQTFKYGTSLNSALIESDLNNAAIAAGVIGGTTKNVEFRIAGYLGATYSNPLVYSNVVNINLTSYVAAPDNLYIIGDATPESPQWDNSSNLAPAQQFTKINAVSFGIIINLTKGKGYLFLPEDMGLWTHKWGGATDGVNSAGTLLADNAVPGSNTPAPATSGLYKIIVNFQTNTYTVTPYTGIPLPTAIGVNKGLWIIGDATPGGWNNSPKNSPDGIGNQQFTQVSNAEYKITVSLTATKSYLLLPEDINLWSNKYGGATDGTEAGGGTLLFNNSVPGSNTPAPTATGNYQVDVNFIIGKYIVTPQ